MTQNFLPCDRDQQMLLAADLREWLADDHLAWFVLDAVSELELERFFAGYRSDGWGRAAHDPEMMVALLLYAYAVGERSSRRIEKRCAEDIAFRVIAANQAPDHTTIARFRARHQDELAELFSEVLVLCRKAGLVSVGTLALDGTRIAADAADRQNRTYEQLAREILEEAAEVDAAEDAEFGDRRGDELPGDRRSRKQRLRDAKRRLDQEHAAKEAEMAAWEAAMAEHTARTGYVRKGNPPKPRPIAPKESQRVNVTDPDSRPVKTATGFIQGYTAQAAATEDQVIVAAELITGANERQRLEPMTKTAEAELKRAGVGEKPELVLADAGYWNTPQIEALEERGARVLCPPRRRPPQGAGEDPLGTRLRADAKTTSRTRGRGGLPAKTADGRAGLRPDQVATESRAVLAARVIRLPRRVASDGGDPQPLEALHGRFEASNGLIGRFGVSISDHHSPLPRLSPPSRGFRDRLHAKRESRARLSRASQRQAYTRPDINLLLAGLPARRRA